ncbi:imidazole glycerol phosphate synthase subunit HisH [Kordiimonas sp. SCSIO 12603]|uniref:imidazole glycerol phosphate synthase subunit HisH n=1 Tax=Kordiimonas sp. SCSIO 12603 TaxID=2829596 RepID=UPI0021045170|nr:imidazole glycerol phosphate synthase subunit HisH [Kordiimonas sp. SCSIO 12603]UTW59029.1 imidazole glycerol phosphate synthase subunit HisH [Kordiimonas sp. SCSIO 12603]
MSETAAIIDYGSGNLRSAEKALARAAKEAGLNTNVIVTDSPEAVLQADRIILPGVGAFADCRRGLLAIDGLKDAIREQVRENGKPFLGICVGMQLMAEEGHEHGIHKGMGWVNGTVKPMQPTDKSLKIPHMGWNKVSVTEAGKTHPVASVLNADDHAYFVHSFHMELADESALLATTEYGGQVTAIVGKDNMIGTQFHPEKSQTVGLKFLKAFLEWQP